MSNALPPIGGIGDNAYQDQSSNTLDREALDSMDAEDARRTADAERVNGIHARLNSIWSLFLNDLTPLRTEWYAAWRAVANAVGRGDVDGVVSAILPTVDLFRQIDERVSKWVDEARLFQSQQRPGWPIAPLRVEESEYMDRLWVMCFDRSERNRPADIVKAMFDEAASPRDPLTSGAREGIRLLRSIQLGANEKDIRSRLQVAGGLAFLSGLTASLAATVLPPATGYVFEPGELPMMNERGQAVEAGRVVGCFGMKAKVELVDWLRVKVATPRVSTTAIAADRADVLTQATSQTPAVVGEPPVRDAIPEGAANLSGCDPALPTGDVRESLTVYGDPEADSINIGVIVDGVAKPLDSLTDWAFIKAMLPAVHGRRVAKRYVSDAVKKMKRRKQDYGQNWAKGQAKRSSDALGSTGSNFALRTHATFVVWVHGTDGITDQDSP